MILTSREYTILKHHWLPEIETCNKTRARCSRCRKKNHQPWKNLCRACTQQEHLLKDEHIRSLDDHGFVTNCTYGCTGLDVATWIIGCDYYHIWHNEDKQYQVSVTEEICVVCENCIQNALTRPILSKESIVWMRNVRLIRKVQTTQHGILDREVTELLAGLGF